MINLIRTTLFSLVAITLPFSVAQAAALSFGGEAGMGVMYSGDVEENGEVITESTIDWISTFDITVMGEGTTDGGLTFGASATIETFGDSNGMIGGSKVYIGNDNFQITIGDVDPASDMAHSLNDVGFNGLGVDDVAELEGVDSTIGAEFNLGSATIAVSAGQTSGSAYIPAIDSMPAMYRTRFSADFTPNKKTESTSTVFTIYRDGVGPIPTIPADSSPFKYMGSNHYIVSGEIYEVNGCQDTDSGMAGTAVAVECLSLEASQKGITEQDIEAGADKADKHVGTVASIVELGSSEYIPATPGKPAVAAASGKTQWSAGLSFDAGPATLGFGMDSNKLMQASVGADMGSFSGSVFYSQQKMEEAKLTGLGVEVGVAAGSNTTISALYTQGKTDYEMASMEDTTSKGFGVGVAQNLGGGATLTAGLAKVAKVTKASVGVEMSF